MKKLISMLAICAVTLVNSEQPNTVTKKTTIKKCSKTKATKQYQQFQAEDKTIGEFWPNKNKGTAKIDGIEYVNVVAIEEKNVLNKKYKKLRKGKDYLGSYIDTNNGLEYFMYGTKKYQKLDDDIAGNDEFTDQKIIEDYGPGE
ncbi:MAG: hypothetical protein ACXWL2_01755 [Candidatus Chromulinivorax sp.]